jgi:hypothetical protein
MKKYFLLSGLSLLLMFTLWSFSKEDPNDQGIVTIYFEGRTDRSVFLMERITIIYVDGFSETEEVWVERNENPAKAELLLNDKLNVFYKRGYKIVGQSQSDKGDGGFLLCYTLQK